MSTATPTVPRRRARRAGCCFRQISSDADQANISPCKISDVKKVEEVSSTTASDEGDKSEYCVPNHDTRDTPGVSETRDAEDCTTPVKQRVEPIMQSEGETRDTEDCSSPVKQRVEPIKQSEGETRDTEDCSSPVKQRVEPIKQPEGDITFFPCDDDSFVSCLDAMSSGGISNGQAEDPIAVDVPRDVQGVTPINRHVFESALEKCMVFPSTWRVGHSSPAAEIVYDFEPGSDHVWIHSAAHLPNCTLAEVLCGMNEITQWPNWHPIVKKADYVGPVDKFGHAIHAHNRILFFTSDLNSIVTRFLYNGMIIEAVRSVEPTEDTYYVPVNGTRTDARGYVVYMQTGSGVTLLTHTRLELPFHVPVVLLNFFMKVSCPRMVHDFQNMLNSVKDEKKPYKALMTKDRTGIYAAVDEMASKFASTKLLNWYDWSSFRAIASKYVTLSEDPMCLTSR